MFPTHRASNLNHTTRHGVDSLNDLQSMFFLMNFGIARSVRLSVPWRSCLGYRHAGCLQLSHRRPPDMCGLRTRPRTDADPPRFLPPSNCHRRGDAYRLAAPGAIPCCDCVIRLWAAKCRQLNFGDRAFGLFTVIWDLRATSTAIKIAPRHWTNTPLSLLPLPFRFLPSLTAPLLPFPFLPTH